MTKRRRGPPSTSTSSSSTLLTKSTAILAIIIIGVSSCSKTFAFSFTGRNNIHTTTTTQRSLFQKHTRPTSPTTTSSSSWFSQPTATDNNIILRHQQCSIATLSLNANAASSSDDNNANNNNNKANESPLCDLQTFLRMCSLVDTGGAAKTAIQNSQCILNDNVETRRSKKLYDGDTVTFGSAVNIDVASMVKEKGYVYKVKAKKVKPMAKVVDEDGNLEFGGRYRSEEWRKERKVKKAERKTKNKGN
mmetsp:Transcript_16591/g.35912  ORF Transcript_16591/g.35912 Transcript_16591/m.35912 type:complete len:248 (+) Transcript_16591:166-909(+)